MKSKEILLLLFTFPFMWSCIGYPSYWRAERYKSTTPQIVRQTPFTQLEFKPYLVGSDLLDVELKAHNEDAYSANSPYQAYFRLYNGGELYESVFVHNVSITINGSKFEQFTLKQNQKEISTPFESYIRNGGTYVRTAFSTSFFEIDHRAGHIVSILVDIEVFSKDESHRSAINFKFDPIVEKGLWEWGDL